MPSELGQRVFVLLPDAAVLDGAVPRVCSEWAALVRGLADAWYCTLPTGTTPGTVHPSPAVIVSVLTRSGIMDVTEKYVTKGVRVRFVEDALPIGSLRDSEPAPSYMPSSPEHSPWLSPSAPLLYPPEGGGLDLYA